MSDPEGLADLVRQTRRVPGYRPVPILVNEDDHFDFDRPRNHMLAAVGEYASWGYFDYRMAGEGFDAGHQSVPVNWGSPANGSGLREGQADHGSVTAMGPDASECPRGASPGPLRIWPSQVDLSMEIRDAGIRERAGAIVVRSGQDAALTGPPTRATRSC